MGVSGTDPAYRTKRSNLEGRPRDIPRGAPLVGRSIAGCGLRSNFRIGDNLLGTRASDAR